jgi:AcrR family transcriptional regulator
VIVRVIQLYRTDVKDRCIATRYHPRLMGHRERLLEGAKRSILDRGYGRTTARDIVAASGTNLASIGYHWGSKDALLTAAMIEAIGEWGDAVEAILRGTPAGDPVDKMEQIWQGALDSIAANRPLWVASVDILAAAERDPRLKEMLADALEGARAGLAAMIQGDRPPADAAEARALGALCLAILEGMLLQTLIDPERAPTARELAAAIRAVGRTSVG